MSEMIKYIKNLFRRRRRHLDHIETLEERIISLEKHLLESQHMLAKQSELLSVVASIQCDIIGVMFKESPKAIKKDKKSSQKRTLIVIPSDDDFIN